MQHNSRTNVVDVNTVRLRRKQGKDMLRYTLGMLAAGTMIFIAAGAQATTVADFKLNGSLAKAVGNGVTLTSNGGTLGAQGITFGANQGPSTFGLGSRAAFTINVGFTPDAPNGPRGDGYVRLTDFSGLQSDNG